jgi:hypothetical protein
MPATVNRPNRVGNSARATTRAFPDCFRRFIAIGHYSRLRGIASPSAISVAARLAALRPLPLTALVVSA